MPTLAELRAQTERNVEQGHRVIEQQRQWIASQHAVGLDTAKDERLLATFERTQKLYEADLARLIEKEQKLQR